MSQYFIILFPLWFLLILLLGILSYFFLTRVIKIEHDEFHEQWNIDDRPHGMPFWFPKDKSAYLLGFSNTWRKGYFWLIKTPDWVKDNKGAFRMFRYYRGTSYILFLLALTMIVLSY